MIRYLLIIALALCAIYSRVQLHQMQQMGYMEKQRLYYLGYDDAFKDKKKGFVFDEE